MAEKPRQKTVSEIPETKQGYEEQQSVLQDLTFQTASSCFEQQNQTLNAKRMRALGLMNTAGKYTGLGLLLSDQCMHTMKLNVFQGTRNNTLRECTELRGSLLAQLSDAYTYLEGVNPKQIVFRGLTETEERSYPSDAVREGLLNAVLHRDYGFRDSTIINIYDDRIEFVTLGGLNGITVDDLNLGISVLRNPGLAQVFSELHRIGAYGTGIALIRSSYAGCYRSPQFEASGHAFRLTLPNRSYREENPFALFPPPYQKQEDEREKRILDLTRSKGYISRKDIESELHVSQSMAILILRKMTEKGLLIKEGAGKNRLYWAR